MLEQNKKEILEPISENELKGKLDPRFFKMQELKLLKNLVDGFSHGELKDNIAELSERIEKVINEVKEEPYYEGTLKLWKDEIARILAHRIKSFQGKSEMSTQPGEIIITPSPQDERTVNFFVSSEQKPTEISGTNSSLCNFDDVISPRIEKLRADLSDILNKAQ